MYLGKGGIRILWRETHPHSANNRNRALGSLHASKFQLQLKAPRQARRFTSQAPIPTQRGLQFDLPCRNPAQHVFRRQWSRREQGKDSGSAKRVAPYKQRRANEKENNSCEGKTQNIRCHLQLPAKQNAARKRDGKC